MKLKNKITTGVLAFAGAFILGGSLNANAALKTPDVSEWQGNFTNNQVKNLKKEAPMVILRVQSGSLYRDKTFQHNLALVKKNKLPYGVYSFSQYLNPADARQEAKDLYARAPHAKFYVNDYEQQTVTSGGTNAATKAWAQEMHKLAGKRKVLFYSYQNFMLTYASKAVSAYDGYWLAAYQSAKPVREHVLWQYTDAHYFQSLGQSTDASIKNKPLSWFIGKTADRFDSKKYYTGGRKVNERVRVNNGAKTFDTKQTIDPALTKKNLVIKQTKDVRAGHSKQAVLVANGNTIIGWYLAQDVTAYYSSPVVKKVQVIHPKGIYTYGRKQRKRVSHLKRGQKATVEAVTKKYGVNKFLTGNGHHTYYTANKNYVKWIK